MSTGSRLEVLRAEARFHRERLDLYRARAYGSRPTSAERLRELQRASDLAQERLETFLRDRVPTAPQGPGATA